MTTAVTRNLDRYIPERAWLDRQDVVVYTDTHGIGHITRVLVWTAQLVAISAEPPRTAELFWAAGLHDIRRHDEGKDAGHGERAATWVRERFEQVRPHDAAGLDLERIAALCRDHVTSDEDIELWTPELTVLKDADGLERVRIWDLDVRRLRMPGSPALEPLAWKLMERSVAAGNTAEAVRRTAIEMGLWF